MLAPIITIDHLACEAGGRTILDIAQIKIARGERVAIVGANGAGKTTLLRAMSGFAKPSRGSIDALGHRVGPKLDRDDLRALRADVAHVMQGLHLVHRLTAIENVLIGGLSRMHGLRGALHSWTRISRSSDRADAHAALVAVGLAGKAQTRADRLSGGERQKVAIARMLMQRPKVILADEPTASLDPQAAAEVCHLLARAAASTTLVSVVHTLSLLPLLADRVIGLHEGRVVFDLPLSQVDDTRIAQLYRSNSATPSVVYMTPRFSTSTLTAESEST